MATLKMIGRVEKKPGPGLSSASRAILAKIRPSLETADDNVEFELAVEGNETHKDARKAINAFAKEKDRKVRLRRLPENPVTFWFEGQYVARGRGIAASDGAVKPKIRKKK